MKQLINRSAIITLFATIVLLLFQFIAFAQQSPDVKVNNTDVGTWIGQNWIWIVGIIVVLLIILLVSSGRRHQSKTTTIRRDIDGRTTTVTTVKDE